MDAMDEPRGEKAVRPPQVTTASWLIMIGSVLLVVGAFNTVSGLYSIETRQTIEKMLSEQPLTGTGLDLESVRTAIHVAALVLGGCATAAAILGYQVMRRDRTARLVLTVLAVPLVLAGMATDPFLAPMVGAAIAMLWIQPARSWFTLRA
jgi:hypothetical protein